MTATLEALLETLAARDIHLWVEERTRLRFRGPKGALTPELGEQLKAQKDAIIAWLSETEAAEAIPRLPDADTYALSQAQWRLWVLTQMDPGSVAYNFPLHFEVRGPLRRSALEQAFTALAARHESLRTTFTTRDGEPRQRVHAKPDLQIGFEDLGADADPLAAAVARGRAHATQPFDLARGPLMRVTLLRLSEQHHVVLLTLHHIVADGTSLGILVREFSQLYAAAIDGRPDPLPPLKLQYRDYAAWQSVLLERGAMDADRRYWIEALAGELPVLALPLDAPRPGVQTFAGRELGWHLPPDQASRVAALARSQNASIFMLLSAAVKVLLQRYTGQEDFVIGSPVAGRTHADLDGQVGFYLNMLPLRDRVSPSMRFSDVLQQVRSTAASAYDHQAYPFDRLVNDLNLPRDLSRSPVFDVVVILQNQQESELELAGLETRPLFDHNGTSKADLTFNFKESSRGLAIGIEFNTDLFVEERIRRMGGHFLRVLDEVVRDPQQAIGSIDLLSNAERGELAASNDTAIGYPATLTLVDLVRQTVAASPDRIACRCGAASLTYRQLQARADAVAALLARKGVAPGDAVGVYLDRSLDLVPVLLGILGCGAAYVPLDPAFPAERLRYMVDDSQARLVVTTSALAAAAPSAKTLALDTALGDTALGDADPDDDALRDDEASVVLPRPKPRDLAYVIYTSGSTGRPKGVALEHQSLVNFLCSMQREPGLGAGDTLLAVTTLSFDIAGLELFLPLLCGATVVVATREQATDGVRLQALLRESGATVMQATPATWQLMLESGWQGDPGLTVLCGGEALPQELARRLAGACGRVWNLYGPTETTIWSSVLDVTRALTDEAVQADATMAIGHPIANTSMHVLDGSLQVVPVGVPGELYIGGDGLARGYVHLPEVTAERFVPDPFAAAAGARMYRTGDLAVRCFDGTLEFLGRLDDQVKLRGFRIEIGEIENTLLMHPMVAATAVVLQPIAGGPRLLAAVVRRAGDPNVDDEALIGVLRQHLRGALPEYMVPGAFVVLDDLPRTPNGKIDRKALRGRQVSVGAGKTWTAPSTPMERLIAAIWEEVLEVTGVGADADFFELGGHSLKAARLAFRVSEVTGVRLTLMEVFQHPAVAAMARLAEARPAARAGAGQPRLDVPIPVAPPDSRGSYPASDAQRRLWVLDQMNPESASYNVPGAMRITGPVDEVAFARALDTLVRRHDSLRTSFAVVDGEVRQVVQDDVAVPLTRVSVAHESDPEAAARALIAEQAARPFSLGTAPLMSASLLELAAGDRVFAFNIHHIVCDAWSLGVLFRELMTLYEAFAHGATNPLEPLRLQYKDVAAWQHQRQEAGELAGARQYWLDQFAGELPVLELPRDLPRPAVQTFAGGQVSREIPWDTVTRLERIGSTAGATMFMTLLAAARVLLLRYTGQRDVVIGTPVSGRTHPDLEQQVGFYVNLLPLRTAVDPAETFLEALARVRDAAGSAYEHDYPFDRLVDELDLKRDLSRSSLFDVLLTLEEESASVRAPQGLGVEPFGFAVAVAKYDLTLFFTRSPGSLSLTINYNSGLFRGERIEALVRHCVHLLESVAVRPDVPLLDVPMASLEELAEVRDAFGRAPAPYPRERSIAEVFEAQARATPEAEAVVSETAQGEIVRLTYRELDERATRVADGLRARGVDLETPVGVLLERSERVAVALLGILKAGGCYVPLEPSSPRSRVDLVVADAGCRVVIDEAMLVELLAGRRGLPHRDSLPDRDRVGEAGLAPVGWAFTARQTGKNLAYIMYTSGSTGEPKGTLIEQQSVLRLVLGSNYLQLGPRDRMLQTGSLAFDASTLEIWGPLLNGGCVCFAPGEDVIVAGAAQALVARHHITAMWVTASLLNQWVDEGADVFAGLRCLLTGGEKLSPWHIGRIRQRYPQLTLVNGYGPTENTTFTACHQIEHVDQGDIPIGRPIANTSVLILDEHGAVCPIGVAGEICAGGDGLARGYLNRPDLTAERFVPHPFGQGERLYRTGDLGRWRWDGTIEFLGRRDLQVKVRGYRIEPGEIEARLLQHPGITEACVLARASDDGTQQLVAYVVSDAELGSGAVRDHLADTLPPYMVPARVVRVERMPLTRNGKVDRTALPDPEDGDDRREQYQAPRTPVERALCAIWSDVLRIGDVGVHDNFFELGGHSLKATRVLTRIHRELTDRVTLRDLFACPDVASLAARIGGAPSSVRAAILRAPDAAHYPASHAQRRLWLLQRLSGDTGAYNVPGAVMLEGDLDPAALSSAFTRLVERHESLRTGLSEIDGNVFQRVLPPFAVVIPVADVSGALVPEDEARRRAAADAAVGFALDEPPLFRVSLFRLGPRRHVFAFNLHHSVTDGWSMRVLLAELIELYRASVSGSPERLPPLAVQYRDYAIWQREELAAEAGDAHRRYWLDRFRDEVPALELPSDGARPAVQTFRGDVVRSALDADTVARLRRLGQEHGATIYVVLLALVRVLLFRHARQEEFVLGTGVSGREHADLEGQVGFYVNMLPLRQRVTPDETFLDVLRRTRDTVSEALEHQAYPFDLLVGELQVRREMGRQPMFDVVVTLEEDEGRAGGFDPAAAVPGLRVMPFDVSAPFSKFDLMFAFGCGAEGPCTVALEYSTDLFEAGRIKRMTGHLAQLVSSVLRDVTEPVASIDLLHQRERGLLMRFAGQATPYPSDRTIAGQFELQAERTPEAIAVVAGERRLTYRELDARADVVAQALRTRGVTLEDRVGVRLERSERVVVALLGILKAGGCYVPLEAAAPEERTAYIVADAGCRLVIDEAMLAEFEAEALAGRQGLPHRDRPADVGRDFAARQTGRHLAYVMYTSGSTGQPKGALIEQRSVLRLVLGANYLQLGAGDRMLQTGSLAFDASTLEIWGPLLNGGCVCFAKGEELLDAAGVRAAIARHGITAMFVTTSLFNQLVDGDEEVFGGLRCLMTGGERVSVAHMNTVRRRSPGLSLLHVYGPTENTTFTTFYPVEREHTNDVPIGRPLSNTTVYVLDEQGGLAPIGVVGEICTGGDGLARGYLNRPELTADRFVAFAIDPGGRVYRTGDLGRWRTDGAIEFIGRRDNQVKVHGYRVEPGEIETCLLQHPGVVQAAVLARETTAGTRELVAYYAGDETARIAEVRAHLTDALPPYMIPSAFIRLPALPLNQNGKIDRRLLPSMQPEADAEEEAAFEPPQTEEERVLAEVWGAVLDRPRIGRGDHYFDSGGDSIRAIQIVNRLRKTGWTFHVRELFQHPVLSDAARLLVPTTAPAQPRAAWQGPIPLTPIQRWFFTRAGDLHHFNHAVLLACAPGIREDVLCAAVTALVEHHAALRLAVSADPSGQPSAMIDLGAGAAAQSACDVRDLRDAGVEAWQQDMQAVQRGFDLAGGSLFKAVLYRLAGGDRLLLVAHHLIIDGVSWRIVLEDLEQAYQALDAGGQPSLTPQAHGYAEWAAALQQHATTRNWSADRAYWSSVCAEPGERVPHDVANGEAAAPQTYGNCAAVEITLAAEPTRALLSDVHAAFNTGIDDILLTAVARALRRAHGATRTWIAMEGHGRDAVPGVDVSGAVGWFTSVYPFLLPLDGSDARQQIRHVKEALRAARRHAPGYTALRWLGAAPALDVLPPDCRISFNYMGQVDDAHQGSHQGSGRFTLSDEGGGDLISPTVEREHELEIGGVVRNGRLTLSVTYNRARHTEDLARRLLDDIGGELPVLLAECRDAHAERTPSDFTGCALALAAYDALLAANGWSAGGIEDIYPLTPMQEGLLFQSLLDASSRAYFLQLNYRMVGSLDVDLFRQAWNEVARRHAVLRASIVHEGVDRPLQVILADRLPEIRVEDLSHVPADERERRIDEWRRLDMARGVDLQRDPLMRLAVLRLSAGDHHIVWSYHHVMLDGWSLGVLYREFQEAYRALGRAEVPDLQAPRPFADYMRWLLRQDADAAKRYWGGYLQGYAPSGVVEQLAAAASQTEDEGDGEYALRLDRDLSERLTQTAAAEGVTLNTMVQALWAVLLARHTGSRDIAFGAVVSGRPSALPGVEEMVGLFINTIPVRLRIDEAEPFSALLDRMQGEALAAEPYHFFPLAETQAAQAGQLFDHLLVFENYPLERGAAVETEAGATRVEAFEAHDRTHYDLDLTIVPGEPLEIRFNYNTGRFDAGTVERLASHYAGIAAAAVAAPAQPISTLWRVSRAEEAALLAIGRGPRVTYPVEQPLAALFEAQAAAVPHAIAARHAGRGMTYAELNARANRIAHWLREAGVGRGDFVGLLERRGLDLLAAMLGVLKAGGAFLPIDPEYPDERIRYMLEDSGVRVVIRRADLESADLGARPAENLPAVSGPRDTAYLLYTSGSTGQPKGAMVRQDGAVNHICAEFDLLRFHRGTVFLQSAPSSSDISVWQFLAPGLIGARTVVADYEDVADPAKLFALLRMEGVTLFELVPVVLKGLLDHAATLPAADRALPALEWAMVTGETVPVSLVNQWIATYPGVPIVNAYGPTEAADDICQAAITAPLPAGAATVPIGVPLANLRLYVLDEARQLVPFGAAGEICVSGIGVGAGYWQDEARTAAAFVPNPYADGPEDEVVYRTGDRGRWKADGTLECLGRIDQQVKIRGFRIELEEVENRLLEHPALRHAAAGVREVAGDPALVAWVVGDAPVSELREHLATRLPKHMVPSFFVRVATLPLTPAGKIDRQALPDPDASGVERTRDHVPPATDVERQLAAIWSEVLQVPRIGRHDSFFDLGGHSLKAMQVVSRVHRDMGTRISLQDAFSHPTLVALAVLVTGGSASAFEAIEPAPPQPDYELSHAQKRLWLLHNLEGRVAYNMPEAVILDEPVDRDALQRAFATLVERHEVLRTAFVMIDGEPRQQILDAVDFTIREVDLTGAASEEDAASQAAALTAAEAAVPFDLTQPPLLRAVLYTLTPSREVFLMVMHHVIGDGWSMNVLYREILALYAAYRGRQPDPLQPLRIQYKDFACWQNRQDMSRDERYWLAALAGAPGEIALPRDTAASGDRDFTGSIEHLRLDAATTARLQAVAAAHGTTLSNVVLSLFQLFLYQWTRQDDICVGLAIANRNRPDLENLIGFFVNILPIRVQLSSDMEFADLLALVKARTTEAFEHQDYPFDLLVQRLNPGRERNRQPVLNVMYGFQNFEDVSIDIGLKQRAAPDATPDRAPAALVRPFKVPFETSKFDLTLFVTDMEGELQLSLEYDTSLFRRDTIRRALTALGRFAERVE